jgi:hypothetical protein
METKLFKEASSSPSDCRRYEIREDQIRRQIGEDQIRRQIREDQIREDGLVRSHSLEDVVSE